jgi:hypothetical protein
MNMKVRNSLARRPPCIKPYVVTVRERLQPSIQDLLGSVDQFHDGPLLDRAGIKPGFDDSLRDHQCVARGNGKTIKDRERQLV